MMQSLERPDAVLIGAGIMSVTLFCKSLILQDHNLPQTTKYQVSPAQKGHTVFG